MKKNKINFSLMLIVSTIAGGTFFFSCSKNEKEVAPLSPGHYSSPLSAAPYTACPNVANADNPYDQVGVIHNDGLDYALMHQAEWPCDRGAMTQKAIELTTNFCCENGYGQPGDCYAATSGLVTGTVNTYQSNSIDDIINANGSNALKNYTHSLMDEINSYTDSTQIDSLLTSIKQLEGQVTASTLNADEKRTFLESASVARYSACYWFQETQKQASVWGHCPGNPIPAGKYNWTKLLVVVCADVAGYIVGNVPGGIGLSTVVASI